MSDEMNTSKLSTLTPSERASVRALAARVIAAAGADEEWPLPAEVERGLGTLWHAAESETRALVFKLALEICEQAKERNELLVLRHLVKRIDETLRVPAAEYVPAIQDVFGLIDALGKESP